MRHSTTVKCALLVGCMASTALSVAQDRRPPGHKRPISGQPGAAVQAPAGQIIWRARLRLVTADVNDAGSDDDLKVTLVGGNLPPYQSVLSETYLDRRADDRERGSTDWYDLRLQDLRTLGELREIRFEKRGADGWAMKSWMLEINGHPLAGDTTGVLWFEKGGDYSLQHAFSISEQAMAALPPTSQPRRFDATELRGRIEASFGHAMQATNATTDDLTWRESNEDIGLESESSHHLKVTVHMLRKTSTGFASPGTGAARMVFNLSFDAENGWLVVRKDGVDFEGSWSQQLKDRMGQAAQDVANGFNSKFFTTSVVQQNLVVSF